MRTIYLFLSYFAMFTLGLYSASQFKFGDPVETHKWIIAIILFSFFGILSEVYKNR